MNGIPLATRELHIFTGLHGHARVSLQISDRGCGIAPEQLERVFEPFETTKPNGLGMGLAVCRNIISAHRGDLWAAANADGGTSVFFTLPASVRQIA